MLKAYQMDNDNDYPVYIKFSEIIRIELLDLDAIDDKSVWASGTVHTRDGETFSVGILGIEQLKKEFQLDLSF